MYRMVTRSDLCSLVCKGLLLSVKVVITLIYFPFAGIHTGLFLFFCVCVCVFGGGGGGGKRVTYHN